MHNNKTDYAGEPSYIIQCEDGMFKMFPHCHEYIQHLKEQWREKQDEEFNLFWKKSGAV